MDSTSFVSSTLVSWLLDFPHAPTSPYQRHPPLTQNSLLIKKPGIHRSHVNQPEHYVSCAQVEITGGGSGAPGPTVQFPGAYQDSDPYATVSIYGGPVDFPFPGPAVWSG